MRRTTVDVLDSVLARVRDDDLAADPHDDGIALADVAGVIGRDPQRVARIGTAAPSAQDDWVSLLAEAMSELLDLAQRREEKS